MSKNILVLPGDGIGPEIMQEAKKVMTQINQQFQLDLVFDEAQSVVLQSMQPVCRCQKKHWKKRKAVMPFYWQQWVALSGIN